MPPRQRHVALVLSLNKHFDRKVITGITRFVHATPHWSVFFEDDPQAKIPDFNRGHFDGVIADLDDPRIPKQVAGLSIPVVGIGQIRDDSPIALDISTIGTNNEEVARLAAEHLISRGLKHFAYFRVHNRTVDAWSRVRMEAFVERVRGHDRECHVHTARHSAARSWDQLQDELAAWLTQLPKPLGLMAENDSRARLVLEACRRSGLHVPEDVAVIGVDNDELVCNLANPPLSSVVQGTEEMGYQAAALLDRHMRGSARKPTHRKIDPVAVVARESTDLVDTDDPVVSVALKLIRRHACNGLRVVDIARAADVSRSTLDARFSHIVGRPVHAEIHRVRFSAARELLVTTDLPLEEIALRTGFSNAQYLSAVFRRELNQTPGEYRRQAR